MDASCSKNDDNENEKITFLYKTMRERDPRKRRVKPVAHNLVQDFGGLEDSEEDSDFDISKLMGGSLGDDELGEGGSGSGDAGDNSDDDDDDDISSASEVNDSIKPVVEETVDKKDLESEDDESDGSDVSDDESEDESYEEGNNITDDEGAEGEEDNQTSKPKSLGIMLSMIDSDEEDDEDYVPKKKKKKSEKAGKINQNAPKGPGKHSKQKAQIQIEELDSASALWEAAPQGRIKVMVCCVCLSDRSSEDDEIVECDNCGISVHEGCYGISESQSTASTESSASTEPWFCDACKANASPTCELCPNTGGIFKETDTGRWVHLVCGLYTPGVAFGDVDRLAVLTLYEMPYSRWGAKECSICEDSRFTHTGVCINCDAGMCKAYFHVTCAQREGLLSEASPEDVGDIADPFFAYCKLHADKYVSKMKRRNWLAIQSQVKSHKPNVLLEEKEKLRFERKLGRHRNKYTKAKLQRHPPWMPTQKMVRHLHSSPSAVRGFLRKAEMMGVLTPSHTAPAEKVEARKKVQGQAQFTQDFISYFMERNVKVDNTKKALSELAKQKLILQRQEKEVRDRYEQMQLEVNKQREKENQLRQKGESLCGILGNIYGKPVPNLPEVFRERKKTKSPSKADVTSPLCSVSLIHQCDICKKTTEQHLLAKCDSCIKHYHLACLDPPLTRMPKKAKNFDWQCSFCTKSSTDDSMVAAPEVVAQPRRLRETIKEPDKFLNLSHIHDSFRNQQRKKLLTKKRRKQMSAAKKAGPRSSSTPKSSALKTAGPFKRKLSPKPKLSPDKLPVVKSAESSTLRVADVLLCGQSLDQLDIMCVVCNKDGTPADTVRCDDCMLSYHLLCLDPPMKRSPKVRGYAWHCEACDNSDSDSEPRARTADRSERPLKRPSGREASSSIVFDIDASSDDNA